LIRQTLTQKNDYKRSAMPLCKAKNRPHDIRKMITRTDPVEFWLRWRTMGALGEPPL